MVQALCLTNVQRLQKDGLQGSTVCWCKWVHIYQDDQKHLTEL